MGVFLVIILMSLVGVLGDAILKYAGQGPGYINVRWFIIGFVVYASTAVGWFYAFKHTKLGSLGVIYALTTITALTLVGVFYFKEKLNAWELLGLGLAIISVLLLKKFA
ncbi:MAG: transporter [Candidatus Magasanikbacteria bacterium]|nr:transporter [Candidatus Magasanikbacteria bacterium]